MVKPEKFGHLLLFYHFTVPVSAFFGQLFESFVLKFQYDQPIIHLLYPAMENL